MTDIDRGRIKELAEREKATFLGMHRESGRLYERAKGSLLAGVPMNWMVRWAGPYPVFVTEAKGPG